MRQFTQINRRLKLQTAAGQDKLQLIGFSGLEEMSRPFRFSLDLVSNQHNIKPADIVGTRMSFAIVMPDAAETERWFDGFVSRFSYCGTDDRANASQYQAEVVPWIWFMGRTSDCRIFQNRSIVEIVREVLGDCPHCNFDDTTLDTGSYPKLEYCVQYRETDLAFVSRLLERAGIFYFFRHRNGEHKLVLGDSKSAYVECLEKDVTLYSSIGEAQDRDMLISWRRQAEFRSGAIASTDYNFKTPTTNLRTAASTAMPHTGTHEYELFEYPGNYPNTADGDQMVNVRIEEQESLHDVVNGTSRCCTFHAGGHFTVSHHYNEAESGRAWTLIGVKHEASLAGSYVSTTNGNGHVNTDAADVSYSNDFVCIPAETIFRPAQLTPRPVVGGLQTAIVVGERGQDIQVDDFGRIRLQFFWDRRGNKRADASRWVRVAQSWAGPGYGTWFLPRVGNEVVVAYEDGDPDRPLVVGSVYHNDNKIPFLQPGNKTQSGIKSRSTQDGSSSNFNEIRFEDKKGSEELYVQAEKDKKVLVKNNNSETIQNCETLSVSVNRTKSIGKNETTSVGVDRTETVGSNETISIGANRTEKVGANETITIAANRTENVGANEAVTIGANKTETVGGMRALTISLADAESIGLAKALSIGAAYQVSVGGLMNETVGALKMVQVGGNSSEVVGGDKSISASGNMTGSATEIALSAKTKLVLSCGASTIELTPSLITIKSPLVKINC